MTPKISVITCTYNSDQTLLKNLESVWNDSRPYEQIIIDAFSSDKTIDIVQEFQNTGHNIKIYQEKPAGISNAMNHGLGLLAKD